MNIQFKLLDRRFKENLTPLPCYHSDNAAGIDLRLMTEDFIELFPGDQGLFPAGFAYQIESYLDDKPNVVGLIVPRSSLGLKGLILQNTVGVVDYDYQGPVMLALRNIGFNPLRIEACERVAQLIFVNISRVTSFSIVEEFPYKSARGVGGFGSTGKS